MVQLSKRGLTGVLLQNQSSMMAMREAFLLSSFLTVMALVAMYFVPRKSKNQQAQEGVNVMSYGVKARTPPRSIG